MRARVEAMEQETKFQRFMHALRRDWQLYLMLIPTILWLLVFLYKPMYGLQIAFKDYSIFRGVAGSAWIGLEHFQTLFQNDQFIRAVRNTVIISFYGLIFLVLKVILKKMVRI